MRYYRLQRGFTTRQLADKLKTVPATVLGYEQGKFPIPHDIAVALSEMLKMPRKTIFDDFCLFIDTPIQSGCKIRECYTLSQVEFPERADTAPSIYAKWESGYRRPSRKMYLRLKNTYPEI